ncbi:MAG: hypothetical protein CM15mP21_4980 [Hyphomicrobiales bacterium]|nr:MAG: hypothetical protein CM15mP21_4980 [Hyphomicrobiales bacterium]
MIHLAEKTGKLLPLRPRHAPGFQLVDVPNGGIGPMMGQANVFSDIFPKNSTCH